MPQYKDEEFVHGEIREETRLLIVEYDTLIPVILVEQRQIYLIHLQAKDLKATIYMSQLYEYKDLHESDSMNKRGNSTVELDSQDGSFNQQTNTIISALSNYIFELLEDLQVPGYDEQKVKGEEVLVTTVENDEDMLVYLCSVAERIIFQKPITEIKGNFSEPRRKTIELQRLKMISAFIQFFN